MTIFNNSVFTKFCSYLKGSNKDSITVKEVLSHKAQLQAWIPFYVETIDSITNKPLAQFYKTKKTDEFSIKVSKNLYLKNSFTDSIYNSVPDSMPFYDWITNDIHQKKFNFGDIKDTITISLNDSNDHYTPPVEGKITSEFGKRRWRYHYGTDIDLNTGDKVRSAFNGRVRISTYSKTYGHVVVVRHNNGLETLYAHLSKRKVKVEIKTTWI